MSASRAGETVIESFEKLSEDEGYVARCHLCPTVKWATTSARALYELSFHYDRRHQGWTHGKVTVAARWFTETGGALAAQVDRLWPHENDPAYRAGCLAEEAGEVNRAITKRRHATHSPDGTCKGLTVVEWNENLRVELAQALGVILDIAYREGIELASEVEKCVDVLRERNVGS